MKNVFRGLAIVGLIVVALVLRAGAGDAGRRLAKEATAPTVTRRSDSEILTLAFQQVAKELNASPPTQTDSAVRIDSALAGPGPRITYFSTLTKLESALADSAALANAYSAGLIRSACTKMRNSMRRGAVAVYVYSSSDRRRILSIEVGDSDCVRAGLP